MRQHTYPMIQFPLLGFTCHFQEEVSTRDAELTGWVIYSTSESLGKDKAGCEPTFVMKKDLASFETRDPFTPREGTLT